MRMEASSDSPRQVAEKCRQIEEDLSGSGLMYLDSWTKLCARYFPSHRSNWIRVLGFWLQGVATVGCMRPCCDRMLMVIECRRVSALQFVL